MTETQNLEAKTKIEAEKIKTEPVKDDYHLKNCGECGCLITAEVHKSYKGVCGICLGLTQYSRELKEMLQNKK